MLADVDTFTLNGLVDKPEPKLPESKLSSDLATGVRPN